MAIVASPHTVPRFDAPYRPVHCEPGREIRQVVGLRPYRKSGFVLRRDETGGRAVIHNYGHGGCGVTLSWGCAQMAADLAVEEDGREAAVIGAGVIGLTTAMELVRRGFSVTVYGADLPPYTTSNVAAALWKPTTLFDPAVVDGAFMDCFRQAARIAYRAFHHLAGDPRWGIRWIRFINLAEREGPLPPEQDFGAPGLFPGADEAEAAGRRLGFAGAFGFYAMMIDPDIFLDTLMRDIRLAGGRIEQRRFGRADEIMALSQKLIFNCTGLGAKTLFGDDELTPVSGQLSYMMPQPEVDYGYFCGTDSGGADRGWLYMYPRQGSIVLGGNALVGNEILTPDSAERERILSGHAGLMARLGERLAGS